MPPANKRRRTSTQSPTNPEHDKHSLFTQWSQDRGVQILSVKPSNIPGRGIGLVTTSKIQKDIQIMFVPEKAMFKPLPFTSKTTPRYPSPQAHLSMSLMSECLRPSTSSPYHTWRSTWPTIHDFQSSLPLFWPQHLASHLPPSISQPLERMRDDYQTDWTFVHAIHRDWDESEFMYYWAIVNSRSFHFKPPGAKPGYMVLCPYVDYMNHGPSGTGVRVNQTPKGYEVVADRDYDIGEEILATYGSHPNDKLLVHYGFVASSGPDEASDDDIRLDHVLLPKLSSTTRSQLQDVGYLGSYALLPRSSNRSKAEICFKTQVAIRAELLTANEWEYFMLNGEDMTSDQSDKVFDWLRPLVDGYRALARAKLSELEKIEVKEGSEEAGAVFWLKVRWRQIEEALQAFLQAE